MNTKSSCKQCPRRCGADRTHGASGYCGAPWDFSVARASLHAWEEPCISGTNGSGTIFFTGCNLRCVFCQNRDISHNGNGIRLDGNSLEQLMLRLRDAGAHNINLVTPTPYALQLIPVLTQVKPRLGIPIVYNCGGYESVDTLRQLEGLIDIYLPDFKYLSAELAANYSGAADYFQTALAALHEMLRQTGKPVMDSTGLLRRGVAVRHLVLPGSRTDSLKLLQELFDSFGNEAFLLSLMSQYTPAFAVDSPFSVLRRRLTSFEYESVLTRAAALGFQGYLQAKTSATADFTPDFCDRGLLEQL